MAAPWRVKTQSLGSSSPAGADVDDAADTVREGIANVEGAVGVGANAVGAIEPGQRGERAQGFKGSWFLFGVIGAAAGDGRDFVFGEVDAADDVIFGVGDVDETFGVDRDALRSVERGRSGGAQVAGVAGFARAGDVVEDAVGFR